MTARDLKLLDTIEKHRYLRADQAAALCFSNIKKHKQRQSVANARLLILYRNKFVQRCRYPNEPYTYFVRGSSRSHKMNHFLTINQVLLDIMAVAPAGSRIEYDIEQRVGHMISDLVIRYRNEFRKEQLTYYIEVDLDSSGDMAAKIAGYEDALEDVENCALIIVSKRRAQIAGKDYMIPVQLLPLGDIRFFKYGGVCFK